MDHTVLFEAPCKDCKIMDSYPARPHRQPSTLIVVSAPTFVRKLKPDSTVIPELEENPREGRSRMGKEKQDNVIEENTEEIVIKKNINKQFSFILSEINMCLSNELIRITSFHF